MIRASQNRQRAPDVEHALRLHEQLARRRRWRLRLTAGSALACALSLLLWLAGLPVTWHLVAVATALLAGALLPFNGLSAWALRWIGARAGLSYEAALELPGDSDPYGLGAAVRERAALQLRRLEPPREQAWWLPLLVTALLLSVLPVTPFRAVPRALPFLNPAPETPSDAAAQEAAEDSAALPEDPQPFTPNEEAPPALSSEQPATLEDASGLGESAPDSISDRVADDDALADFLDTVREQAPSDESPLSEGERNPFSSVNPQPQAEQPEGAQPQDRSQSDSREGEGQGEQSAESPGGEPSGEQQPGEQGAEPQGSPSQTEQPPGSEQAAGDGPEEQPSGEQNAPGPDSSAAGQQPPEAELAPSEGEAGTGAGDEQETLEGTAGNEAGDQAGFAAEEAQPSGLSGPQGAPEVLQGERGDGPTNLAGTARLPADPDEAASLSGSSAGSFSRAREEAIQEGRIPLEYQDIVRQYFR